MSEIAFFLGNTVIRYDAALIALAALVCLFTSLALYTRQGGRAAVLCLLTPVMWALSFVLCRSVYWACHPEQFASLPAALADRRVWGYCLCGIPLGFGLTALLGRAVALEKRTRLLLDSLAPGLSLGLSLVRLSAAFNGGVRGKVAVTAPALQRLPFAFPDAGGEYRFAAFFVEALLFCLFAGILLAVFLRRYRQDRQSGEVFFLFLLLYSLTELVIDSTRSDAAYFTFNAFISVAQILSAVTVLALLIVYRMRARRTENPGKSRWVIWGLYLLGLIGAGVCEYMVQRHGNRQLLCYSLMTLGCLVMLLGVRLAARRTE